MAAVLLCCPNLACRLESPINCNCSAISSRWRRKNMAVCCSAESETRKSHLRVLDSYLERLEGSHTRETGWIIGKEDKSFVKMYSSEESSWKKRISNSSQAHEQNEEEKEDENRQFATIIPEKMRDQGTSRDSPMENDEETYDLHLITALASINIAVFLFELASPVNDTELHSLPLMYGAKINDLIQQGEWWRLLTPMFLHSDVFHVALGCWSLLTFGRQVCRGYGRLTFFLIYTLGGAFGNLASYLHTPEPTVGGTGPIFALIGAWLVYQYQCKEATAAHVGYGGVFHKAVMTTGIAFILSHFGPIDDWNHLGATFSGIVFGFFTAPSTEVDEIEWRRRHSDPLQSLAVFAMFSVFFFAVVLLAQPALDPEIDIFTLL